jgi:hypothetical protein
MVPNSKAMNCREAGESKELKDGGDSAEGLYFLDLLMISSSDLRQQFARGERKKNPNLSSRQIERAGRWQSSR